MTPENSEARTGFPARNWVIEVKTTYVKNNIIRNAKPIDRGMRTKDRLGSRLVAVELGSCVTIL